MATEVAFTDEFNQWWHTLTRHEQRALGSRLSRLRVYGMTLPRKYSKTVDVRDRDRVEMRELRVQVDGRPLRALYVFDPSLKAVVLLGGDKTGDDDFYTRNIPRAYDLYDAYRTRSERED